MNRGDSMKILYLPDKAISILAQASAAVLWGNAFASLVMWKSLQAYKNIYIYNKK